MPEVEPVMSAVLPVRNIGYSIWGYCAAHQTPFARKIPAKRAGPKADPFFLPIGELIPQFLKAYTDSGLKGTSIKLIGTGDLTDESVIDAAGEVARAVIVVVDIVGADFPIVAENIARVGNRINGSLKRIGRIAVIDGSICQGDHDADE